MRTPVISGAMSRPSWLRAVSTLTITSRSPEELRAAAAPHAMKNPAATQRPERAAGVGNRTGAAAARQAQKTAAVATGALSKPVNASATKPAHAVTSTLPRSREVTGGGVTTPP
jgi:hypothetical protein